MSHPFDKLTAGQLQERPSLKWQYFGEDVLAAWVADMDFPPAQEIFAGMAKYAAMGDLGYPPMEGLPGLREALVDRLQERYGLEVPAQNILPVSGIIPGLYTATRVLAGPGEGVIVQPPVYPPFYSAVTDNHRVLVHNPMVETEDGWRLDLEGLEKVITPSTRLLMLCNPHNPTGRVFSREELTGLAAIVTRHRLWVVADELHADLTLEGRFQPFAGISEEAAMRTLTLYGPTKAFNIAGLKIGFLFSHNDEIVELVRGAMEGVVTPPNVLAQAAAMAAYRQAGGWLDDTLEYLRGNARFVARYVEEKLPGVRLHPGEATYLAWLDFRALNLDEPAAHYLLERAKVALNPGESFAPEQPEFEGFARLNFATSRGILEEMLERIRTALEAAQPAAGARGAASR